MSFVIIHVQKGDGVSIDLKEKRREMNGWKS